MPYVVGFAAFGVLYLLYGVASSWNPLELVEGEDGRLSTSKFQFWLWTLVVVFGYCALAFIWLKQHWLELGPTLPTPPRNLLVAMGLSVGTAAAAKGITVSYVSSGRKIKTPASKKAFSQIFEDDGGNPDLSKVQMVAWTFIAISVFLVQIAGHVQKGYVDLPDIDVALVALMGIGQVAYLGNKLVPADAPRLLTVTPTPTPRSPQPTITVTGTGFGDNFVVRRQSGLRISGG
jgi:hypothetical protein